MKHLIEESSQPLDYIIWGITILFFVGSALLLGGNVGASFMGAAGIIILMFFVGLSIELILSALQHIKWLGKITGFITNGPEALVLLVGLLGGNIIFAASTPLWSNFMNPVLLGVAIFITGYYAMLKNFTHKYFFLAGFSVTAFLAIAFFGLDYITDRPEDLYLAWIAISLTVTFFLFTKKFPENEEIKEMDDTAKSYYLPLGIILLLASGFFLDYIVSFTAEASKAPKWVIGFLVLATLTSWPEFKSVLALLKRKKTLDAFINILVSNITNLWLAVVWIVIWSIFK